MIIIKSKDEIDLMRESGKVTGYVLRTLADIIKPAISTMDINNYVEKTITGYNMYPTFKGYGGFPGAACVSINEEIVHGIPSKERILKEGDVVSVDVGSTWKHYVSDAARTYPVGEISEDALNLIRTTEESFFKGIEFAKVGHRLSDVSHAIQEHAERAGFGVIRDYVGHGVGRNLHEDPPIPNYGDPGKGPRLQEGMVLAIEPMIVQGSYKTETLLNDWTVVTVDGGLSAHYENTIVINDGEPELLTL